MPVLCDKSSMVLYSKASSGWRFGGVMVTLIYAVKPEYSSFFFFFFFLFKLDGYDPTFKFPFQTSAQDCRG